MTETDADPPAVPAPAPRRWGWRPKLRWFAAEYLIVVLGVLTAVALNAWWGERQDRAREQSYLRQLAADLHETERIYSESDSIMVERVAPAISSLYQSFGSPDHAPRDSVLRWVFDISWFETPRPVLGTAEALIATGDLALIRSDSLRSALTAYLDESRRLLEEQASLLESATEGQQAIDERADGAEHIASWPESEREAFRAFFPISGFIPGTGWVAPFQLDVDAFYDDPAVYRGVQDVGLSNALAIFARREMMTSSASLRRRIERELAR